MSYVIGLDYGTNSVRCLIVNTANGEEVGTSIYEYESGESGIVLDAGDHNVARQNPSDYIRGIELTIKGAIAEAISQDKSFGADKVIGIGVDTTGSTPMPVTEKGVPLSMLPAYKGNINAMAWLWKDHTSYKEAARITELAAAHRPEYLAKCGGIYSSEWFFSKIWHCLNVDQQVFMGAYTWVEYCDWITAVLSGTDVTPDKMVRSRCAAGHKAFYNEQWGGLPDKEFLAMLDPRLADLRDRLYDTTAAVDSEAGKLTKEWAHKLGLPAGIPIAVAAFDCHLGAIGAGVAPGTMVKVIGTSTCDIMVADSKSELADIPGVCGIVDGSVLPGYFGIEAGQSAVGDIFNWFVNYIQPGGKEDGSHVSLTKKAAGLKPGQSGLLALDWNNGNRTILVDQLLTGLLLGQTLHTRPEEIYLALVEATAFGALTIINRIEEYGVKIKEVVNCGGIAEKNPMVMQIYADICNREMKVSRSAQTCALGSAIAAAVVAGAYKDFSSAQKAMSGVKDVVYKPNPANVKVYARLYKLYKQLHDGFGVAGNTISMAGVMKELLDIKRQANQ
ncbi:MAG: ribulokinase [Sedimentisphaerales bacterium]|nr:ribulokinase [Sedimentisphaerales bacterium]MBN2842664.1 ribulokinase [Sedimentisphaerales bacterium]